MTPQERELLGTFLQQMTQAQAGPKDAEAETLIREAVARQPDAAYLLVQRAMGLDYALQATQGQVAKLQAEIEQLRPNKTASFLNDPNAWGRSMSPAASMASPASNPAQAPLAPLAPGTLSRAAAPAAAAPASSWGGAGILGTVATTAAGVVAGSLLYQGIQGMMGHHNPVADAGAHTPSPPAPDHLAARADGADEAPDDSADYADASGGDFDSGDSA